MPRGDLHQIFKAGAMEVSFAKESGLLSQCEFAPHGVDLCT